MLVLIKVACPFGSVTTFPGYISMYTGVHLHVPLKEVYMANASSGIPVRVLHLIL